MPISPHFRRLSGYGLIYGGQSMSNIGDGYLIGGTSTVAPFYAAFIAVMNGVMQSIPGFQSIGHLNSHLYQLASTNPDIFYENNDGGNNNFNDVNGYQAGPVRGWNACTGLGSVNGLALELQLTTGEIPGFPDAQHSSCISSISS
jgi:kumamolisin